MDEQRKDPALDELLDDVRHLLDDNVPHAKEDVRFSRELRPGDDKLRQTQRIPGHVKKLQKNQEKAYADWLYEQGGGEPAQTPEQQKKPPKKRSVLATLAVTLLVLALLASAAVVFLLPQQPSAGGLRKEQVSTILLAGTDSSGARTDALLLLTLDGKNKTVTVVSIPRDTLINGSYTVPKLNSVYGANNGGEAGMEMLLTRVGQCIGFEPDGCIVVELEQVEAFVDALGGVEFDVPADLYYEDPAQQLVIDLQAGRQTLTGAEAVGLVRFRSGYADADLGRVQVQRAFLATLMEKTVSAQGLLQSPRLLEILLQTRSTLSARNYLWLARTALLTDPAKAETATLPGNALWLSDGGSYYVLDAASVADTVNAYCNPYVLDITTADLDIRTQR